MWEKFLLTVLILLCLFSGISFGSDFIQSQNDIIALIKSGQTESAKSGIDKFIADNSKSPDLPGTLCWIAEEYGYAGKRDEEKNIYQQIIQNYPDSPAANKAKLGFASAEIRTFIISQDYDAAKEAIDKLIVDFNDSPDLPDVLYRIGRGYEWSDKYYEWSNKYQQAKNIFQRIVDKYPGSGKFDKARLGVYRMNICSLIVSKQFESAQDEFDKMITDFSRHPDLPDTLEIIGRRYESSDRYSEANSIYEQVISNWPDSSYARKARFGIQRAQVRWFILSEDFNEAQIQLDNFISDFNSHPDLPEALYWIAQRYGYSGRYEEEKNLYQRIIQNYSGTLYADRAKLDLAGAEVLTLIVSENDVDTNSVFDKMVSDFNGNSYLIKAIVFMADKCHDEALRAAAGQEDGNKPLSGSLLKGNSLRDRLYRFVIEMFEKYAFDRISGKDNETEAYYRAAVAAYRLGDSDKTIEYSENVLQADPNFRYAANMLWLAASGYERMKAAGEIPAQEGDLIIEETYQELMDKYPGNKIADWAAMHLGMINYRQGKNIKACAYFGWYLMNASPDSAQDKIRMEAIRNLTERCGRNSNGK